jgi:chromosome segregation ATPase
MEHKCENCEYSENCNIDCLWCSHQKVHTSNVLSCNFTPKAQPEEVKNIYNCAESGCCEVVNKLQSEVEKLKEEYHYYKDLAYDRLQEIKKCCGEQKELRCENEILNGEIENLQSELKHQKYLNESISDTANMRNSKIEQLQSELAKAKDENKKLEELATRRSEALYNLNSIKEFKIQDLEMEIYELKRRSKSLREEKEQEAIAKTANELGAGWSKRVTKLELDLLDKDNRIVFLEAIVNEDTDFQQKISELEEEVERLKAELKKYKNTIHQLNVQIENLGMEKESQMWEYAGLLQTAKSELSDLKAKIKELLQ